MALSLRLTRSSPARSYKNVCCFIILTTLINVEVVYRFAYSLNPKPPTLHILSTQSQTRPINLLWRWKQLLISKRCFIAAKLHSVTSSKNRNLRFHVPTWPKTSQQPLAIYKLAVRCISFMRQGANFVFGIGTCTVKQTSMVDRIAWLQETACVLLLQNAVIPRLTSDPANEFFG